MEEKIIFKTKTGSFLYGTNGETSDTDIKGIFIPKIEDLILGNAPKHYVFSTNNSSQQNTKDDIDETYYSLQYFLELASKGETNALDLLFSYTNKNAVIYIDDIWKELINNVDKIVTKNVNSYLGYCKSQCIKYSIKGDKLNNFNQFKSFLSKYKNYKNENGSYVLLKDAIKKEETILSNNPIDNLGIGKENRSKIVFCKSAEFNFGDHCYFEKAQNKEVYLSISDIKFGMAEDVIACLHKIERTIGSYGKRAEKAYRDNGADYKAISHCARVLFQTEELLTTGKVTFPLKEANFIKSIKYKTSKMSYDEIMDFIDRKIKYIDENILPNSKLREKSDYDFIHDFIIKQYKGNYK